MFERASASVGPGAVRPRRPGPPSAPAGGERRPGPSSGFAGEASRPEPPSGSAGPSGTPVWAGPAGPAAPCPAAQGSVR